MPSALELAITRFRAQLLTFDERALTAMLAVYAPIRTDLIARIDALEAELADGGRLTPGEAVRLARAQELLRQTEAELRRLGALADPAIQAGQQRLIVAAGDQAQALALVSGGSGDLAARIAVSWIRLPTSALEDLVGRLATGAPLRTLLDDLGPQTASAMEDALQCGIAMGQNPRVVADLLTKQVDIAGARLLRITRTEMLNSYRSATLRTYAANDDLLEGWIWTAAKSARTCAACLALDGQVFPLTLDFMPNHVQCRCSPRPKLIGIADPLTETGADWFAQQDAATQDRILSSSAAGHAYRAGEVSLDDFAVLHRDDRWGDSYSAGTLTQARDQAATRRPRAAD
jgi:SPP1 gp7 family putative phage head morphogenesis protein